MVYTTSQLISRLATYSWMKPCDPKGFRKWLIAHVKKEEIMQDEFDGDDLKDPDEFDETEKLWLFVAFLNEKGFITEEKTKLLLDKHEFGSSMMGEWQKEATKRLGVSFR